MGLFDKFKYDGDTLFRLQHILKLYKNETPYFTKDRVPASCLTENSNFSTINCSEK